MDRGQLPRIAIFAAVASAGGFRPAAARLGLSPSAVSHAVGALETALDCRLLQRTTRSLALTEAGRMLLDRVTPALAAIDGACREASEAGGEARGLVRVTAARSAIPYLIEPYIAAFTAAFPEVRLDLASEDRFSDLVAEGYDVGIRLGEHLQPDMIAIRMGGEQRLMLVASAAFCARHGVPDTPEALASMPRIGRRFDNGRLYNWELERDGRPLTIETGEAALVSNDPDTILAAARVGVGVACVWDWQAAAALADGSLVQLLADYMPPFPGFYLYHPSRRQMRPAVRAFIDHFVAANA